MTLRTSSVSVHGMAAHLTTALIAAVIGLTFLIGASTAGAAGFTPEDFDVKIDMGGDGGPGPGPGGGEAPVCTANTDGSQNCTSKTSFKASDQAATGTVTHRSSGITGSISTICDIDMNQSMTFRTTSAPGSPPAGGPGGDMTVVAISGSMTQGCAWHMEFTDDDKSSLTGRIAGSMKMELIDAAAGIMRMSAQFKVDVVSGSGKFADVVGSGTFGHEEESPVFSDGPRGSSVGSKASGSGMNLKLRKGAPAVRIVAGIGKLAKTDDAALRAVAAPGAKCSAAAASGGRKVALGSVPADAKGNVKFKGAIASKLRSGNWKVTVNCKSGGRTAHAKARVKVG